MKKTTTKKTVAVKKSTKTSRKKGKPADASEIVGHLCQLHNLQGTLLNKLRQKV